MFLAHATESDSNQYVLPRLDLWQTDPATSNPITQQLLALHNVGKPHTNYRGNKLPPGNFERCFSEPPPLPGPAIPPTSQPALAGREDPQAPALGSAYGEPRRDIVSAYYPQPAIRRSNRLQGATGPQRLAPNQRAVHPAKPAEEEWLNKISQNDDSDPEEMPNILPASSKKTIAKVEVVSLKRTADDTSEKVTITGELKPELEIMLSQRTQKLLRKPFTTELAGMRHFKAFKAPEFVRWFTTKFLGPAAIERVKDVIYHHNRNIRKNKPPELCVNNASRTKAPDGWNEALYHIGQALDLEGSGSGQTFLKIRNILEFKTLITTAKAIEELKARVSKGNDETLRAYIKELALDSDTADTSGSTSYWPGVLTTALRTHFGMTEGIFYNFSRKARTVLYLSSHYTVGILSILHPSSAVRWLVA